MHDEDLEYLDPNDYFLQTKRIHPKRLLEIRQANTALNKEEWRLYTEAECHREEVLIELDAALKELETLKAELAESALNLSHWQAGLN